MFQPGALVWGKMKGFPPWPGKVVEPPDDIKKPSQKKQLICLYFFGTENYAWLEPQFVKSYFENKELCSKGNRTGSLREAIEAIEKYAESHPDSYMDVSTNNVFSKSGENMNEAFDRLRDSFQDQKLPKHVVKNSTKELESGKRSSSDSINKQSSSKKRRLSFDSPSKLSSLFSTSPSSIYTNHLNTPRKQGVENLLSRPTSIVRPETPPLDVESVSDTLKTKNIQPSSLKFGFLGLGIMGSGIVKNLLNSGHHVTVWNRTPEKDFVKAGAEQGMTPSDVIQMSDVTFCCVSDPQAAKEIVFGNCGVLPEINASKGYIEMTSIDADTSQDISEAINRVGGRYLEAQIQGSKIQAEEGTLVILAAGDRSLFDDCQTCFRAMSLSSFFVGEVGNASKMNLVLQLINGITLAGLAEGLALADRAGLAQKDVLEILELTPLTSKLLLEKGKGGFPTHLPLQHMQKDLKLALDIGDQLEHPLFLTGTANEIYKHAKRIGYGQHDVSAVYVRARF